jgi:hypothetical protein
MNDILGHVSARAQLTPRQDRLEERIVRLLRTHGTRSELREVVHELVDLLRIQRVPPERAIAMVKAVVFRAWPGMAAHGLPAVGDSPADRTELIVAWCAARYYHAD